MPQTNKQVIGALGEQLAADFLDKNGYTIVEKNRRLGKNEIDIIAEDDNYFIFVEVKTRTCLGTETGDYGIPSRAVDFAKRKNTVKAARDYLFLHHTDKQPRIDVIEVYLLDEKEPTLNPKSIKINHIRNAFDARGRKMH